MSILKEGTVYRYWRAVLFTLVLLFELEGHVSEVPVAINLEVMSQRASLIVVAKPKNLKTSDFIAKKIIFIGSGISFKVPSGLHVRGTNESLYKQIEEARLRGEPTPMPYTPVYESQTQKNLTESEERILFLSFDGSSPNNIQNFRYLAEGSFESLKVLEQVKGFLRKTL